MSNENNLNLTEMIREIHDGVAKEMYCKGIDDLCNEFKKDWDEQCENNMEDCINWYDWLIASAEQLKEENEQ